MLRSRAMSRKIGLRALGAPPLQRLHRAKGEDAEQMAGIADDAEAPTVGMETAAHPWSPDPAAIGRPGDRLPDFEQRRLRDGEWSPRLGRPWIAQALEQR